MVLILWHIYEFVSTNSSTSIISKKEVFSFVLPHILKSQRLLTIITITTNFIPVTLSIPSISTLYYNHPSIPSSIHPLPLNLPNTDRPRVLFLPPPTATIL
jgi:hypothetical protein